MARGPRLTIALEAVATVLVIGHMASTCAPHIPDGSALRPIAGLFTPYQALTGTWQSWDMFTTIPYLHAYGVSIEVTEPDGTRSREGLQLPGLLPYDGDIRSEAFFTRVLDEAAFARYLESYAARACAALRDRRGHGGQTFVFHESYERILPLPEIREHGAIARRDERRSKSYTCD